MRDGGTGVRQQQIIEAARIILEAYGKDGRTDRTVQLAGIPNAFLSTITLAERGEDVTEVTMRALVNTKAQREVIQRQGRTSAVARRSDGWWHTSNRVGRGKAWAK
jgi:hypothetical protein